LGLDGEKVFSPETTETWSSKVEQVGCGSMENDKLFVCKAKKLAGKSMYASYSLINVRDVS
jgi:hypothetical protein